MEGTGFTGANQTGRPILHENDKVSSHFGNPDSTIRGAFDQPPKEVEMQQIRQSKQSETLKKEVSQEQLYLKPEQSEEQNLLQNDYAENKEL